MLVLSYRETIALDPARGLAEFDKDHDPAHLGHPVRFLPLAHTTRLFLENSADSDQRASIETIRRAAGPHAVKRWYPGARNPDGSGIDCIGFLVKQLDR